MDNPLLTPTDVANFERVVFAEAAKRALAGRVTARRLALVATVYLGVVGFREWIRTREPTTVPPKPSSPTPTNRQESQETTLDTLLDSISNTVEASAVQTALSIPYEDCSDVEASVERIRVFVESLSNDLADSGAAAEAESFLSFSTSQVAEALRIVRDI